MSSCRFLNRLKCFQCSMKSSRSVDLPLAHFYTTEGTGNHETEEADIVISGGGMVGSALACSLGQERILEDKKIVLLESGQRREKSFDSSGKYGNRVSCLSKASSRFLKRLGAWDKIKEMRVQPVSQMQVWESCSDSRITLHHDDMTHEIAYIVENDVILDAITQSMEEGTGDRVDVRYGCKAFGYDLSTDNQSYVSVLLDSGKTIHTKLLIGADGVKSEVRKSAGFHVMGWSYNQTAVVATLHITQAENTTAWQRFLPSGPIALLPLTDTLSSLVWSTKHDEAQRLMEMSQESFVDAVNDALFHERHKNELAVQIGSTYNSLLQTFFPGNHGGRQLPPTVMGVDADSRATFPLGISHSSQYVARRLALVGDAAHRVHPLAGQGVNLGFGDVAELTGVLVGAASKGADIGNINDLLQYETSRQRHNLPVMMTIDGLRHLYSTHLTPVVLLRTLGLQTTNAIKFIKDRIISQATNS